MKHQRCLQHFIVLLLAVLAVNPAMQAANRKARPTQKQNAAKTAAPSPQEDFQKHIERQLADVKEDVYSRATWKKLEEVKQEADSTAGTVKMVTFSAAGIGFILGSVVTFLFAR